MSKRKADQSLPPDEQERPVGSRRSARLRGVTAAAAVAEEEEEQQRQQQQQEQQPAAAATSRPFQQLATVELQLIMQHCDLQALLSLARCSQFTLSAASDPFAWRALSPLSFATTINGLGHLRGSRLLSHCDVALRWLPPTEAAVPPAVKDAELAAIESVPRLVELDTRAREIKSAQLRRLLSHPALAGLTMLHSNTSQMDDGCIALLPLHQPRLRTLSLEVNPDFDANRRLLVPLALLLSLSDLSLDGVASGIDEGAAEIIGRCASLRRLHLSRVQPAVLFAVLSAPARARLETLSLRDVSARPFLPFGAAVPPMPAADVQSWKASFENLQSLQSLSLQYCTGHDVIFAGAAAALATGIALRSLTALRADTLKMDNADGSLIPLLAVHCPQLRRLHICGYDCGALAGLPLLSSLTDLRSCCDRWRANNDVLAVGRCASLTRLHLTDIRRSSLHFILRSPQMQRLESLTLASVRIDRDVDEDAAADSDVDWSVCFANLRSLRALSLDACDGGDRLLAGVRAARPPLLCSIRFRHLGNVPVEPELRLLEALLVQLPALRIELVKQSMRGRASRGWQKQVATMHKALGKSQRRHPARITLTRPGKFGPDLFNSWSD